MQPMKKMYQVWTSLAMSRVEGYLHLTVNKFGAGAVQGYSGTHDIGDSGIFNLHPPSQWPLSVILWSQFAAGAPTIKPHSSR